MSAAVTVVETPTQVAIEDDEVITVTIDDTAITVVTVGEQGPQGVAGPVGPAGPPSSGGTTEVPAGTINGVNAVFTLSASPVSLLVFRNGLLQKIGAGNDYLWSGSTVTFQAGAVPEPGDGLLVVY